MSEEDVRKPALANKKSCPLDPIQASILSVCLEELLPVITRMVNMPLGTVHFSNDWKYPLVQPTLLVLFDTVDEGIGLRMLQSLFGLQGRTLSWFHSYLEGRAKRISGNGTLSNRFALQCDVQQGSHLGLLIFAIYTSEVFEILRSHLPSAHVYADDTQLYMSFRPSDGLNALEAVTELENCILHVRVLR